MTCIIYFFFSSRRRHTRFKCDWSSDVCSSDLLLHLHGDLSQLRQRYALASGVGEREVADPGHIVAGGAPRTRPPPPGAGGPPPRGPGAPPGPGTQPPPARPRGPAPHPPPVPRPRGAP